MTGTSPADDTIACPSCGEMTPRQGNYCEHCGKELPTQTNKSAVAGAEAEVGAAEPDSSETLVLRPDDVKKAQTSREPIQGHVVAYKTDIGHKHSVNQDAGEAWTGRRPDGRPVSMIVVADGVSAGRHSEGASKLLVDRIQGHLAPLLEDPGQSAEALVAALVEAARAANSEIAQRPHHSLSSADATTLVAAVCVGEEGGGAWCGDSRVYHLSGPQLTRLTRDHSWAEGVVSHGLMSAEDAARDPRAHMITRWLGPPERDDPGIETFRFTVAPGDVIMCCTDGLYMYFAPPASQEVEMAQTLASYPDDLQAGLDQLVNLALQRGGRDNVTVAAISGRAVRSEDVDSTTELPAFSREEMTQTLHLSPRARSKRPAKH